MRRLATAVVLCTPASALAQEAMYTEAATMPSPHVFVIREQFNCFRFGLNPESGVERTDVYQSMTSVSYGLAPALAVRLDVPVEYRVDHTPGGHEDADRGVSDLELMFKYRFYKSDTGGVDTVRAVVLGGTAFASGDDHDFSSGSVNPVIGGVLTVVRGRHGFNQDLIFRWNTGGGGFGGNFGGEGPSEALKYDSAYLYRIAPARFTATSKGAWYVTAELNGLYETNGDNEIRISPGLMYEGWDMAFELMAQFPLIEQLDHRAELDFSLGVRGALDLLSAAGAAYAALRWAMHHEAQRGGFFISDDPGLIDLDAVHAVLTTIYWSEGIPKETVRRGIEGSISFGVYDRTGGRTPGKLVGFARVITDKATFAYLSDVFIIEEYRGRGLSKWLMEVILAHPELQGLRRFCLLTKDAHGLYARFGFKGLEDPGRYMEITDPGVYTRGE